MNIKILLLTVATTVSLTACTSDMSRDSKPAVDDRRQVKNVVPSKQEAKAAAPARELDEVAAPTTTGAVSKAVRRDRTRRQAQDQAAVGASSSLQRETPRLSVAAPNPAAAAALYHLKSNADREKYNAFKDGGIKRVAQTPVSTFSIDVDTGAYSNVRRFLNQGALPPENAVRVEELINYFDYDYAHAEKGGHPFAVDTELAPTPWNTDTVLLKIGIHGEEMDEDRDQAANLVFLVDVSGSMRHPNKLSLVKKSLLMLVRHLEAKDSVAIVVYAGSSGVVLEPVAGDQKSKIRDAIESLRAGGGTNGADGIRTAYRLAREHFVNDGVNRVVLTTDGDFNVGTVDFDELKALVEHERKSGVYLTTLGFGQGNYNDHLMEQLADSGNGNYAYIDTVHEARKVLVDELGSTLFTIAKDVKIQIEFNPAQVDEYRLVGYENRMLAREDFNDDRVDAGEIGAGHTVTALYEVALKGRGSKRVDPLRYRSQTDHDSSDVDTVTASTDELAFVKLRYKKPDASKSTLIEHAVENVTTGVTTDMVSVDMRFASAVAGFGQLLRGGRYLSDTANGFGYADVLEIAQQARGKDPHGYRAEFIKLVKAAESLDAIVTGDVRDRVVRERRNQG